MIAIIPAAGYATRLYPLTLNTPKALLDVQGKPLIEHIIARIAEIKDVKKIVVVTNNKFYEQFQEWAGSFNSAIPVTVLNDNTISNEDRLGQVGDMQFAIETEGIDDDLLMVAGDNLFNFRLVEMNDFFKKVKAIVNGCYDLQSSEAAKRFGNMTLAEDKRVVRFVEKPANPESTLASIGIIFFPKEKVKLISTYLKSGNSADKIGNFFEWFISKEPVYGFPFKEGWFDAGSPDTLEQARKEFVQ